MTTLAIAGSTAPQAGHLQKPSKTKGKSHQNPRATESEPSFLPCCLSSFHPSFLASLLPCFLPSFLPSWLRTFLPSFLPSVLPSFLPSFLPSLPSCLSLFLFFIFLLTHFQWAREPKNRNASKNKYNSGYQEKNKNESIKK